MSDINADIESLIRGTDRIRGGCSVRSILERIQNDHGADVEAKMRGIMEDVDYGAERIVTLLRKHGYRIGRTSINKHRKRGTLEGCTCQ